MNDYITGQGSPGCCGQNGQTAWPRQQQADYSQPVPGYQTGAQQQTAQTPQQATTALSQQQAAWQQAVQSQAAQSGQLVVPPAGVLQQPGVLPASLTPADLQPITALNQPMPVTTQSLQYMNAFLRTQIGKKVTVDFLIGTNTLVDRTGTLLGVGANYIVINETETDDILICDFYTIKFIHVYY